MTAVSTSTSGRVLRGFASRLRVLLTDTELLIVPPVEYGIDGEMLFEVAGKQDALQSLVANLPDRLSVSVNRLGEYDAYRDSQVTALTYRQEEVLEVARELGYYKVPRQTSVREIGRVAKRSRLCTLN